MTKTINVDSFPIKIFIGREGENDFRPIRFDTSSWLNEYPNGLISVIYQRPDGELYPVIVNAEGPIIEWKPNKTDTAISGNGSLEIRLTQDDILGKSVVFTTIVHSSLGQTDNPPDSPAPDWTVEVANNALIAQEAAQEAKEAVGIIDSVQQITLGALPKVEITSFTSGDNALSTTIALIPGNIYKLTSAKQGWADTVEVQCSIVDGDIYVLSDDNQDNINYNRFYFTNTTLWVNSSWVQQYKPDMISIESVGLGFDIPTVRKTRVVKQEEIESDVFGNLCIVAEKGAFYDELVIELNGYADFLFPSCFNFCEAIDYTPGAEIIDFIYRSCILGVTYDVFIFRSEESRAAYITSLSPD